ncbi:hypothetical protein [Candidatus Chlamydia corallus]|uniref:hypothetical protein n=1 Tax=Candidatus Chlamydia corallus TaxID=2038470 RepID=UPI000C2FA335|nr:hypothetical protein [Candidatus Chlamydia corallus]
MIVPLLIALIFKCVIRLILHYKYHFEKASSDPKKVSPDPKSLQKTIDNLGSKADQLAGSLGSALGGLFN